MVRHSQASRIISCYFQRADCIRKVSLTLREIEGQDFLSNSFVMARKHCFVVTIDLQCHYSTAIIHKEETDRYKLIKYI